VVGVFNVETSKIRTSLLSVARSTYYYESKNKEPDLNLLLMEEIDRLYLAHPENGSRMMTTILRRGGDELNRKRVQRLMQLMGLRSLSPQPKTTNAHPDHPKYPYLLRGLTVNVPNHVWCSDIT
jgi:putative transposase